MPEWPLPPWLDRLEAQINEVYLAEGNIESVPLELLSTFTQGLYAEGFLSEAEQILSLEDQLFKNASNDVRARNLLLRYSILNSSNRLSEQLSDDVWNDLSERLNEVTRQ